MPYTTFADAAAVVMAPFDAFVLRAHEIMWSVQPIVVLALALLITTKALQLMMSKSPGPLAIEVFLKAGRVVVCFSVALYVGNALGKFDGVIAEVQYALAQLFSQSANEATIYAWKQELGIFKAIDQAIDPFLSKLPELVKKTTDPKKVATNTQDLLGLLVISGATVTSMATLTFAASIAMMVLYFRIALQVCLGLMPLFIIFLAFQATSRLFQSWLATTISYVFSAGIAAVPVGIALTQLEAISSKYATAMAASQNAQTGGVDFVTTPLLATLTMGMLGYMAVRLPPLISRLVGGFVSGASLGDGGHLMGGARQSMGLSMNAMRGGGAPARNSKGQFVSRQAAASPLQTFNNGIDRVAQSVMSAKNDWMAAYGVRPAGASPSRSNRRAPQESVADRRATTPDISHLQTTAQPTGVAPPRPSANAPMSR